MSDQTVRKMNSPKNGADGLVLGELERRLDWVGVGSVKARILNELQNEGFIENFNFTDLKVMVNGTWYER